MLRSALIATVLMLAPALALAETTLHLKDGSTLKGTLVSQQNGVITFDGPVGRMQVPEEKVLRIEYGDSAPAATPAPTPEKSIWVDATDEPGTSGGAPVSNTIPSGSKPRSAASLPRTPGFLVTPMLGYHQYRGSGWDDFEGDFEHGFDGPVGEIGIGGSLARADRGEFELHVITGYYGGAASECDELGPEKLCLDLRLQNIYLHAAPRVVFPAGRAQFFAQLGIGMHNSTVFSHIDYENDAAPGNNFEDDDSNVRTTLSFHFAAGGKVDVSPKAGIVVQLRMMFADGEYPDATERWDMGGLTLMTGVAFRL